MDYEEINNIYQIQQDGNGAICNILIFHSSWYIYTTTIVMDNIKYIYDSTISKSLDNIKEL